MILPSMYDLIIQETSCLLEKITHTNDLGIVYKPIVSSLEGNVCGYEICSSQYKKVSAQLQTRVVSGGISPDDHFPLSDRQIRFLMEILMASQISQRHAMGVPLYVSVPAQLLLKECFMKYLEPFLTDYKQINSLFLLIEIDEDTPFPRLFAWLNDSGLIRTRHCLLKWHCNPDGESLLSFHQHFSKWSSIPLVASRIQSQEEYEFALERQIPYIMGPFMAAPQGDITRLKNLPSDQVHVTKYAGNVISETRYPSFSPLIPPVEQITSSTAVLSLHSTGSQAKDLFATNKSFTSPP